MYFKVIVKCERCDCSFDLCPTYFKDRATFSCPNCGQSIDERVSAHLRAGLNEFAQIPNTLKTGTAKQLFSFRVSSGRGSSTDEVNFDTLSELGRLMSEDDRLNRLYTDVAKESAST